MIDPDLERRTAECTELMEYWRQFLDLIYRAVKPPQTITPQLEQQFLNVKARIAMLHDSFMEALKHERGTGQAMIDIVNRAITLRIMTKVSESEIKKIEIEWHEVFLLLNESVTSLHEERARLADINEFAYNLKKRQERILVQLKGIVRSFYFKISAILLVLVFVLFGIPAFGIYDYDNLRDVNKLSGVVKVYLKVARDIGFDSAYYSMADFMKVLPQDSAELDTVKKVTIVTKDRKKDAIIPQLSFFSQDAQDLLKKSQGYDLVKYTSGHNADAYIVVFWLRKTKDAKSIDLSATQSSTIPDNTYVYRKSNVILILKCTNDGFKDSIKKEVINEL